jgi:hypothetical protein
MHRANASYYVHQLKRHYRWLRFGESVLWALAVASVVLSVGLLFSMPLNINLTIGAITGVATLILRILFLGIFSVTERRLLHYLNTHYPQLQASADLMLAQDEQLTTLQRLQKERVLIRFEEIHNRIKLPHKLTQASIALVISVMLYVGLSSFVDRLYFHEAGESAKRERKTEPVAKLPASIEKVVIRITPPGYTRLPEKTVKEVNLSVPEAGMVEWRIEFNGEVQQAFLLFSDQDSLGMIQTNDQFKASRKFSRSGFYQVGWQEKNGLVKFSDFYKIEVVSDHPPAISIEDVNQFIVLTHEDKLAFEVKATVTDDYGLTEAYLVATVSKGSGESVKFREEKLSFTSPAKISGKKIQASRSIDLKKLGLDPGDELYYYVEALDNRTPEANRSRTETYFVSLQDTTTDVAFSDSGLGVDLMPEYFRSQRQIIIDSEKLLSERKKISKQEFNARSNELGYDQKVLRLRYGQFLGEEFESGIGIHQDFAEADDHDDHDEDVAKKYGHVHDKENEHNQVAVQKDPQPHTHRHDNDDPDKKENPLDAFLHAHDSEEEATFFIQSIKMKLKAAITVMWDAELHLRLYDPQKSLPFQYKALNLLKEISQDSRIYVHRVGFDPPPLKEEKRLTGDLSDVRSRSLSNVYDEAELFPAIRQLIPEINNLLLHDDAPITTAHRQLFIRAGQELAGVALQNPVYVEHLSLVKTLVENNISLAEQKVALKKIQRVFWSVLPEETPSPTLRNATLHPLDEQFVKKLQTLRNR